MNEVSEKFPTVRVLSSFLGVDEGTELVFDFYSGKYVSVEEAEDISEVGYYYSGFAIAVDPYLVKRNIGKFFAYLINENEDEQGQRDETEGSSEEGENSESTSNGS